MKKDPPAVAETIEQFTCDLIEALEKSTPVVSQPRSGASVFFSSKLWFFLAVFSVIVNILLLGIILWQHMRIDYLLDRLM